MNETVLFYNITLLEIVINLLVPLIRIDQFCAVVPFDIDYCCHLDSQSMPQIIHVTLIHNAIEGIENTHTF